MKLVNKNDTTHAERLPDRQGDGHAEKETVAIIRRQSAKCEFVSVLLLLTKHGIDRFARVSCFSCFIYGQRK